LKGAKMLKRGDKVTITATYTGLSQDGQTAWVEMPGGMRNIAVPLSAILPDPVEPNSVLDQLMRARAQNEHMLASLRRLYSTVRA
jgi:hypothetical protein